MEERNTSEEPVYVAPTVPARGMELTTYVAPTVPAGGTELTATNGSFLRTMHSLVLIIGLVGLAGNVAVLWLLGFCTRRNAISVYIFNLAGANFIFLSSQVVLSVIYFFHPFYFISISGARELLPVLLCSYMTGLSMLSAISAEHCLSVLWPVWYCHDRPRHTSTVTCAFLWSFSLLLGIFLYRYCFLVYSFSYYLCPELYVITFAWFIFLFLVLTGSSLALLVRIFCGSRQLPMTRLMMTIGLLVLVCLLCGLPVGINLFVVSWFVNTPAPDYYGIIAFFLSCIHSSTNPLVYFFVGSFRKQWQSLKLVLERALRNVAEADKGGERLQDSVEMSGYLCFSDSAATSVHS